MMAGESKTTPGPPAGPHKPGSPPIPSVEERYRHLVQNATDYAFIALDRDGHIYEWNTGAHLIFGYTADEARGQHFSIFFTEEDRAAGAPQHELRQAFETGRAEDERWHVRKSGDLFFASGMTNRVEDSDGQFLGYAKVVRDLTERKLAETEQEKLRRELAQTQSRVAEVSELTNYLLASITHELRTPLTTIIGYSEMIHEELADLGLSRPAGDILTVRQAAEGLIRLINDIVDLAAIQAGRMELHYERFNVAEMAEDLIAAIQPVAEAHGSSVVLQCDSDVDHVIADELRVRQVVQTLLNNAARFTRNGTVTFHCSRSHEGGDWILFRISDSGPGISPDTAEILFAPIEDLVRSPGIRRSRTALSLAISRRYCELMGGQVMVETTTGKGTTFTVCLPLSPQTGQCAGGARGKNAEPESSRGQ